MEIFVAWKKNSSLARSWSDEYFRTSKCDKCRVLLLTATYTHAQQEYRIAYSTNRSHGTGWLCHKCATRQPAPKSRRDRAFATYEQLDNYLIERLKHEKDIWLGKKKDKTAIYTNINENYQCNQ